MMEIIQIVPKFLPATCGIGDQSRILGDRLQNSLDCRSCYLVAGHENQQHTYSREDVAILKRHESTSLLRLIENCAPKAEAVILHWSGYGYERHGCPWWLGAAIAKFAARRDRPLLLTMFHESFANGPVFSPLFFWSKIQRFIVKRIASSSDGVRTNCSAILQWLAAHSGHASEDIPCLPVFSNLGESRQLVKLADRRRAIFVPHTSAANSRNFWIQVAQAARLTKCSEVITTNPATDLTIATIGPDIANRHIGWLSAAEYSQNLERCRFAILDYNPDCLGKSSILAAMAAHGTVPIILDGGTRESDGMAEGRNYLSPRSIAHGVSESACQPVSNSIHEWYQSHNVEATAFNFLEQINRIKALRNGVKNR